MGVRRLVNDYDLQQPWQTDKKLSPDKKFYFGDNYSIRYDSSQGVWIVRNESLGDDILTVGTVVAVSRPFNAEEAIIDGRLSAGTIASGNPLLNKSASPTVATSTGTPTEVTVVEPDTNHLQVIPLGGSITLSGLATGETVTVTIIAHYSDGTTGSISKTLSGNADLTTSDINSLIKDGVYITKIGAEAQSSNTSTSATCTVQISAMQG